MRMDPPSNSADGGTEITMGGQDEPVLGREKAFSWIKRKCRFWLGSCRPSNRLRQSEAVRADEQRLVRGYNRVGSNSYESQDAAMNRCGRQKKNRIPAPSTAPRPGSTEKVNTECSEHKPWNISRQAKSHRGHIASPVIPDCASCEYISAFICCRVSRKLWGYAHYRYSIHVFTYVCANEARDRGAG